MSQISRWICTHIDFCHGRIDRSIRTAKINQKLKIFFSNYENAINAWFIIPAVGTPGLYLKIDQRIIGGVILLIGIFGQAFAGLVVWIGFLPFIGPFIAKIIVLPFIWLLNSIGYLLSLIAIKRGYSKDVLTYQGITIALTIGIILGYILGKIF